MADKTKPLYKSVIVIWSREHPGLQGDIEDLAHEALYGNDTYLADHRITAVEDPEEDQDWDETDFFKIPDTGDGH